MSFAKTFKVDNFLRRLGDFFLLLPKLINKRSSYLGKSLSSFRDGHTNMQLREIKIYVE